jgi:hypothetical protein
MAILREDARLEGNEDRKFPGQIRAPLAPIGALRAIFVPTFTQKTRKFPGFSNILTETSEQALK